MDPEDGAGTSDAGGEQQATESGFRPITSQEQFDKMVASRIKREREQFADGSKRAVNKNYLADLESKAERLKELEEANKTELEKISERAATLERERDQALLQAQEQTLRTAIIGAAAGKLADPSDAVALIDRSAVEFGKDGSPTNVGELVSSLLEAKPHLAASGGARGTSADQGARGTKAGQITREQLRTMTADQITAAQASGQLDHLLRPGG